MIRGFRFDIHDVKEKRRIFLECPEEEYFATLLLGAVNRFAVKRIIHRGTGQVVAACSTDKLNQIAGRYVGKDDPVCIVLCQGDFPAVGEVIEPFAFPHLVPGWMRGSHWGPLMPVSMANSDCTRFDGPPRVVGLGVQITNKKLSVPKDLLGGPAYDGARQLANFIADYMRRHGPFEPHRLPLNEMEYTTLPGVMELLEAQKRWEDLPD